MKVTSTATQSQRRLYRRDLPGGGFVAIDVMARVEGDGERADGSRIRVCVERRASEERRAGHAPPVVAEFAGDHESPELAELLYRVASDNAALARALIELRGRHQRDRQY